MIILDTNVVSEFSRPSPNMGVINWITGLASSNIHITAITEAEVRYGINILPLGQRRERLLSRIERTLRQYFAGRILPFDGKAARSYAAIAAERRSAGRPMNQADCQIAAIAHSLGASLATRNTTDFEGCGIDVIYPWSSE